ncbi:MAG: hypothetical protein LC720_08550, partial [Actinobacteria bacterium]|nr:hypothetical protein [Actinomycetota bacterium]
MAMGFVRYASNNTIDFGFQANFDLRVASVTGSLNGWIEARNPVRFNVDGAGMICVSSVACSSGEVTASTTGTAGCFTLLNFSYPVIVKDRDWAWYKAWKVHTETRMKRIRAGVGYRWSTSTASLMGDACDIGPYHAARSARAATLGYGTIIQVAQHLPVLSLQIHGSSAPPIVVLTAPGGSPVYSQPQSGSRIAPGLVFATDPAQGMTYVEIAKPKAGRWTITSVAGTFNGVQQAPTDEPPTIIAALGEQNQFHRTLGYSYQPDPGHGIRFVEQGPSYEQDLGPAAGRPCPGTAKIKPRPMCGQIAFTPDGAARAGVHRIVAVVTDLNGEITAELPVTTY